MLTPAYLMNVSEPMVELWSQIESDIINDIARRIVKNGGVLTETAKWQIVKARELGVAHNDLKNKLKALTKASDRSVAKMIHDACMTSMDFDDSLYKKAGYDPKPIQQSQALMDVVNAGIRKTNGLMTNFTNTTADTFTKTFERTLDRAYMQVNSGAFSFEEALRHAVRDLATDGIQFITYPSGTTTRMDAAARRALLTGLNQTVAELQLARMDQFETHLIEVTSHAGARPSHALWQGRIYWRGKRVPGYENFEDSTGYGTGDGLCGWNCYHNFFPFIEGVSTRAFERDPSARLGKSNDQVYAESQKQRYYERKIRESRRECAAYSAAKEAATDPATKASMDSLFQESAVKLKRREAALNEYVEQTGRTKLPERVYVPGFGHKVSSQAVWANKKAQAAKVQAQASKKSVATPNANKPKKRVAPPVDKMTGLPDDVSIMGHALSFTSKRKADEYHIKNNFAWDFWNNTLTEAEREGVRSYTGSHYRVMNRDLRTGNYQNSTKKGLIDSATSALQKATIKDDVWVWRGMGDMHDLSLWSGIPVDDLRRPTVREKLIRTQHQLIEKGFMSAGVEPDSAWGGIKLQVCVPAGSHALYVDPISHHRGELELLIQRNSTFRIKDIDADVAGNITKIVLMLIKQELP